MFSILLYFWFNAVPARAEASFVDAKKYDFSLKVDLRYRGQENALHEALYPEEADCLVRRPVAEALRRVQSALYLEGFGLKLWDCYRPTYLQKKWQEHSGQKATAAAIENADRHTRGGAVDATLVDRQGAPLEMPSGFEGVVPSKPSRAARRHLATLNRVMAREGFLPSPAQWWHFDFRDWNQYGSEDVPFSAVSGR